MIYYAVIETRIDKGLGALDTNLITTNEFTANFFAESNNSLYSVMSGGLLKYEVVSVEASDDTGAIIAFQDMCRASTSELQRMLNPRFQLAFAMHSGRLIWYIEIDNGFYFDTNNAVYVTYATSDTIEPIVKEVDAVLNPYIEMNLGVDAYRNILLSNGVEWNNVS